MTQNVKKNPGESNLSDRPLKLLDQRLRHAVSQFRQRQTEPFDSFRGLYVSDRQVDLMLAQNGRLPSAAANGTTVTETTDETTLLFEEASHAWRQQWKYWLTDSEAAHQAGNGTLFARLVHEFALTPAEAFVILLALAPELSPDYERLFAYLQDDVRKTAPTIALALDLWCNTVTERGEMRAVFQPQAILVGSGLLRPFTANDVAFQPLPARRLQLEPAVVAFLCGHLTLAARLSRCATLSPVVSPRLPAWPEPAFLQSLVQRDRATAELPAYIFVGERGLGKGAAARYLAQLQGTAFLHLNLLRVAEQFDNIQAGIDLAMRDGRLAQAHLYIEADDWLIQADAPTWLSRLVAYPYTLIISTSTAWHGTWGEEQRPLFYVHFSHPTANQRRQLWQTYLAPLPIADNLNLALIAAHFALTPSQIKAAVQTAHNQAQWRDDKINQSDLLAAGRAHSQQALRTMATQITPQVGWDDLIVPEETADLLQQIINRVQHKAQVFDTWGWAQKSGRNQGIYALFQGKPGTGKTMAAEVIAHELGCDLYQVDLSLVVSKYIGETEKHLNQTFRLAAQSNAILFFDEADALFGKRSEVRDSHDRYANMEISYLLQRMEQHNGLVILATNFQTNIDTAFRRRLHFIVSFPLPDEESRRRIWATTYPSTMPLASDVDFGLLAQRFELTGGNIRNIMLQAAFLAAEGGQSVGMKQILASTQAEYRKLGLMADAQLFELEDKS